MPKLIDLKGEIFGNLTVLSRYDINNSANKVQWLCLCECGNTTVVNGNALKSGNTKSCGCLSAPNLKGMTFGKLEVLEKLSQSGKDTHTTWKCMCECGNVSNVSSTRLLRGITKSCGCLRSIAHTTHGLRNTPEYGIWLGIKNRCYNKQTARYKDYGGRGITMCDDWKNDFEAFYSDMGPRPSPAYSIDRRNNDENYELGNCRWATDLEQANNTSLNIKYEYAGKTQSLADWCRQLQLNYNQVRQRIYKGMLFEVAIQIDKLTRHASLTLEDETKTIQEWCRKNYVLFPAFRHRLYLGWTLTEALTPIDHMLVDFDGDEMAISQVCELLDLPLHSTCIRVLRGEKFEDILKEDIAWTQ